MERERKNLLVLLLALTLALSACRFPGSTEPLVKIGLVAPFEGRFRARGYEALYAVKLAIRQWNESGAGSYRVELVALDDGGDPVLAAQQVRELAVDADVLGVIGHLSQESTLAAAPEYAAQELVLIAPGVGSGGITAAGWVFQFGPSEQQMVQEAARYAREELGAERLAVLRGGDALADAFVAAAQQWGSKIVLDENIEGEGWASRLVEASPDVVFLALDDLEGAEAIRLARQAGAETLFLGGPALGDRVLIQVGGAAVEGTIYLAAVPAGRDVSGGEDFAMDYQALAGYPPGPRAMLVYEATNLLLEIIARAADVSCGQPSRAAVRQHLTSCLEPAEWPVAIYRIENLDYPGRRLR